MPPRRWSRAAWVGCCASFLACRSCPSCSHPAAAPLGGRWRPVGWSPTLAQRNKSYRWGHEGPDGFDCSGLAWAAWRSAGLRWPRLTADGQWRRGPRVHGRPRPGDLVFFHTRRMPEGHAGHVGVYLGDRRMVEAPAPGARVRIGSTNRPGYLGATRPGARGGS